MSHPVFTPTSSIGTQTYSQRRSRLASNEWVGFIIPASLLISWEVLSTAGILPPNLLPAPSAIALTLWDLIVTGELFGHIAITFYRVLLGFLLGGFTATVFGALTGYSPAIFRLLDPLLQALRNIPSLAWVPLFILWLGIYESSKIALIAVGVFFPVYLNLMMAVQHVDRKLVEVGKVYRLSQFQLIWRVFLPATLPTYIVGLRSGLGLGWMFVVAAEIMGASSGLGYLLVDGQTTGRPDLLIVSILMFAVCGKLSDALLAAIGKRCLNWQDSYSSQA